jgi:hypothetical protein
MQPGRAIAGFFIGVLTIALSAGCANLQSAASGIGASKLYAVTADSTAFYYYSPHQGSGPDKTLLKETPLKMVRSSFSFCKVQLMTGEEGFVAIDDVGVAAPDLIAATYFPARKITATHLRAESPEPRLNAPPEPLPEFEPTPIPLPPNL